MTYVMGGRALVTGASGFCGRALTRRLAAAGIEVHGVTRRTECGEQHIYAVRDISARSLAAVIERARPDAVFHLVGAAAAEEVRALYDANVGYAAALLEGLELAGRRDCPVLVIGSSAEYGAVDAGQLPITESQVALPYSHYGASKLAQTILALTAARQGCPVVIARPFNIIGPGMPAHLALHGFASQAAEVALDRCPAVIEVGNLDAARDLIDVEDAVDAYCALLGQGPWGEIINVCSGRPVTMRELLERLLSIAGVKAEIRIDPARLKLVDVPVHYGSPDKLVRLTGKAPSIKLDATLGRVWRHTIGAVA